MCASGSERRASYVGPRPEVVDFIPQLRGPILDVGCSNGEVGTEIKGRFGEDIHICGIEIDPTLASEARGRLDRVIEADALEGLRKLGTEGFRADLVLFADSLEHMEDPWSVFDAAAALVVDGGYLAVSIPNVTFWDTIWNMLRGAWPYRDRGIHDRTHLRFFARRNVEALLGRGPATLERIERLYRLIDRPSWINRLAPAIAWLWPDLFTYQFLGLARVERTADHG